MNRRKNGLDDTEAQQRLTLKLLTAIKVIAIFLALCSAVALGMAIKYSI
jgi:hypothetical protein